MTQEDPTNPDYYKFPNGAEAIQITQYLSACGSQAAQYVIRATRTDGKIKGDPIEDLEKAIWFIQTELKRLRDTPAAPEPRERQARVFRRLHDIPLGVTVQDRDGDFWRNRGGVIEWRLRASEHFEVSDEDSDYNNVEYGPFTEVRL